MARKTAAAAIEATDPPRLIPEQPITEFMQGSIALTNLAIDTSGPEPDPRFVDTVRRWGLLQPILVQFREPGSRPAGDDRAYYVIDGRRRVRSYQIITAGKPDLEDATYLPCLIFPESATRQEILSARLVIHEHRHANQVAEYDAIRTLIHDGHDMKSIALELGIPIATIKERMRLASLSADLQQWWRDGRMSYDTAKRASGLGGLVQDGLVAQAVAANAKRITDDDVRQARLAKVQPAKRSMFSEMDAQLPARMEDTSPTTQTQVGPLQVLERCREIRDGVAHGHSVVILHAVDEIEAMMKNWI